MATYKDTLSVLDAFRAELHSQRSEEEEGVVSAFSTRGAMSAFSTPLNNIHATGVGVRIRRGEIIPDDFVIKVYVFDKVESTDGIPDLMRQFEGVGVDVEALPIQMALANTKRTQPQSEGDVATATATVRNRERTRPIVGGVSVAPIDVGYVGTLGCFVKLARPGTNIIYALSNNHVFADSNQLPFDTNIVQPGPELGVVFNSGDIFAALNTKIIIEQNRNNLFDAAIAVVRDRSKIQLGTILGISNYTPKLKTPVPGMKVIKSGRTTGVTTGTVTGVGVGLVRVKYEPQGAPSFIASFDRCIQIVGDGGRSFSAPGDSGSVILEAATGRPVALLFAGNNVTTTACDLSSLCQQLGVVPV
jgi:hypothetical protein